MNTNLCNESQEAGGAGRRKAGAAQRLMLEGKFHVEHWRDGKLIGVHDIDNAITVAAKNLLLEVMFRNGTKITVVVHWPGVERHPDAAFGHPGDGHLCQPRGLRRVHQLRRSRPAAVVAGGGGEQERHQQRQPLTFTISTGVASKGIYGLMVVGGGSAASTKGDTAGGGLLWSGAKFTSTVTVNATDVLKVTYTVNS